MVIFQYNLYIFGIHLRIMLYQKPCYNELCYKEVEVYIYKKKCTKGKHISLPSNYETFITNKVLFSKKKIIIIIISKIF